jgi:hypothetical protein
MSKPVAAVVMLLAAATAGPSQSCVPGTNGSKQARCIPIFSCAALFFPRHSLADLPFQHIHRSQRRFTLMQREIPVWPPKLKPTGG